MTTNTNENMQQDKGDDNKEHNFKFIRDIGSGSFGLCFLCERLKDGSLVVLKKTALGSNENESEKVLDEAMMLKEIDHENVVRIFASYLSERNLYMIMEYMPGGDLRKLIDRNEGRQFKDKLIVNYTNQLALALYHIHKIGIIHRDIKPSNILLSEDGKCLKLADFGNAIRLNEGRKLRGSFQQVGTNNYKAPEILDGQFYDHKVDIWALGCVLYELVEHKMAFPGTNEFIVFRNISDGVVVHPDHSKYNDLIQALLSPQRSRPYARDVIGLLEMHKNSSNSGGGRSLLCLLKKPFSSSPI